MLCGSLFALQKPLGKMLCGAQLSLEYLLLLAAVFSIFAMLLPLLAHVYHAGLFGLDSLNAERFASELQASVEGISFQGEGASVELQAFPLNSWLVSSEGEKLSIKVVGPGGNEKVFRVLFPNELGFKAVLLNEKARFFIRNSSGKVLLEHN